jgi:hypothetical protein
LPEYVTVGAVRSIFTGVLVADVSFPAASATSTDAEKLSPSPEITASAGHAAASPEVASAHVQWIATSPEYQPFAFGPVVAAPLTDGGVASRPIVTTTGPEEPPRLLAEQEYVVGS